MSTCTLPQQPDAHRHLTVLARSDLPLEERIRAAAAFSGHRALRAWDSLAVRLDQYTPLPTRDSTQGQMQTALVDSIIRIIFSDWAISFDSTGSDPALVLPGQVYANGQGNCVGIGLLIVLLARRLECPIHAVLLPGHLYCRFDDGSNRRTIEPNRRGFDHPESYYVHRYNLAAATWIDQKALDDNGLIGVLCFNLGTIRLRHGQLKPAVRLLQLATSLTPQLIQAQGNLAIAYERLGRIDTALVLMKELWNRYPGLDGCAQTYSAMLARHGYPEQAAAVMRTITPAGESDRPASLPRLEGL